MAKYHINSKGVPSICRAKSGNCPFGGDDQHFSNANEAESFANKLNEDKYGIFKNVSSNKEYQIPEGTPQEARVDKESFVNENHKLLKSGDNWVHLNNEDEVVGTMKDPIAIYDGKGDLVEIADMDNYSNKMSVQGLKALKTLSRFNLVSKELIDSTSSINFYTPKEDISEYKDDAEKKNTEADIRSFEAFKARINAKGGHETADLFSNGSEDKMNNYFNEIYEHRDKTNSEEGKRTNAVPVDYNPKTDDWSSLPSAKHFSRKTWQENNLDVQMVNNKWAVVDKEGQVYGRLDNPGVAVNFETESVEMIGEYDEINEHCESAKGAQGLLQGSPSPLDKLGSVKFDTKNNNLGKVRKLLSFSWAFKE